MPDKGIMIELRVDMGRIKQVAPLYEETIVVGSGAHTTIVAPADKEYARLAALVQEAIAARTGAELPVVEAEQFSTSSAPRGTVIAIGHAANHPLLRRLHDQKHLGDGDYPDDGSAVLSVHNPYGDGHNVLCALGANPGVARRSVEVLLAQLVERDGALLAPGPILAREPIPQTPDPAELNLERNSDESGFSGRPSSFLQALEHVCKAGEERWARRFIEAVTPFATGEIPLSFWLMSAVDFWTERLVIAWDRVEQLPLFSDDERLLVINFIASCTEYSHDSITYQKWRLVDEDYQVFNHHTFPSRSLYFGASYLQRHGYALPELEGWIDKALAVFARASRAGRSFDEGGAGYSWLVGNHLLDVSMAEGDTSYVESEKIVHYADLAACILNNRRQLVPFGDCGGYHSSPTGAANVLLRAAEWHRDGSYRWLAEQTSPDGRCNDIFTRDLVSEEPQKHVGLFVLSMDPIIHHWAGQPHFPNYPAPPLAPNVPPQQGFDKLSLRGGWGEDDDYLLLQGFGEGQHGHPDANAISQYQVRGRLFLAESDYILRWPKQHNMIMVIKDGQHAPIPVTARLDETVEFAGGALTQTSLLGYNGCDWTRTLLWLKDDCVLVVDDIVANEPGEYELRCYWRTLGDVEQTERGMHADHDGEHFHVVELTDSERRLDTEPIPLNTTDYAKYDFGAAIPYILREKRVHTLQARQHVCFANLLLPTGNTVEKRRSTELGLDNAITVAGSGPVIRVDAEAIEVDGCLHHVFAEALRPLGLADQQWPAFPSSPNAAAATVDWSASLPAPATCATPIGDGRMLVGCEDGSVVMISESGETTVIDKAEDRIGAVLAGCIHGAADITLMAGSYDQTLRFYDAAGRAAMTVNLPRNGHMPAWGCALALGDLDGDGKLWPIVGTGAWRVHAVYPDGALRWTFETAAHTITALDTGDLNGDGRDETVVGTVYYCVPAITGDGGRLWEDEDYNDYWMAGPNFPFVFAADVDGDGLLETITAGTDTLVHCIDNLGEKKWTYSIGDDPAGLAVIDAGIAAASQTGDLHLVDGAGRGIWRIGLGAPCTAMAAADEGLYVATEEAKVFFVQTDGGIASVADLDAPARVLSAVGGGGVLAGCEDGSVSRLHR